MDIHPQHIMSLCTGVAWLDMGLQLGLEHLGIPSRVVCMCERDSYAQAVLLARMADKALEPCAICDSLEDIDGRWRGNIDWVVAGFPCQPWSTAGRKEGINDERWLWPTIVRIIRDVEPQGVFLENVPGLVSGGGFEYVLSSLAEIGFDAEWTHLSASSVGASHKRERVFILAHRTSGRLGELWKPSRRDELFDGSGRRMGNAASRCGWADQPQRLAGERTALERPSDAMVDAENADGRAQLETSGARSRRGGPDGASRDVADAVRILGGERTGRQRVLDDGAEVGAAGIFAPGPNDADTWRRTIDERPYLAPAIEPGLCVLVDGSPVVLDESRTDQLRCSGNGVVAISASVALVELMRRVLK